MRFNFHKVQMQRKKIYGVKSQDNDYLGGAGGSIWKGTLGEC